MNCVECNYMSLRSEEPEGLRIVDPDPAPLRLGSRFIGAF